METHTCKNRTDINHDRTFTDERDADGHSHELGSRPD